MEWERHVSRRERFLLLLLVLLSDGFLRSGVFPPRRDKRNRALFRVGGYPVRESSSPGNRALLERREADKAWIEDYRDANV